MGRSGPDFKAIFTAALERPAGPERAEYLAAACSGDEELLLRLKALLAAHAQASGVLGPSDSPGGGAAAEVPTLADRDADTIDVARSSTGAAVDATERHEPSAERTTKAALGALTQPAGIPETVAEMVDRTRNDTGETGDFAQAPPRARDGDRLTRGTPIRYFGDYEILEELGRGGMGVVYSARQVTLNRPVALKMIKAGVLADDAELRRFQNEAEAVALLDHPGIVPVYEVGDYQGQRFFSLQLIRGGNLAEELGRYRDDPHAAATIVAEAAEAVHHAHMRGILHRDLKPANILMDAEGHPHVTDFGLAKRVEADAELTASGAILGTPAYMSPEQAAGRRGTITTAADVYGLGAILYALLTGKAPFGGDSIPETLDAVRNSAPVPPSRLHARVPRDLETIALKCLHKDPRRRYGSALALAEDLRRWLEHKPITARRVGATERLWLWCKRRPAVAALTSAVLIVSVAGIAFGAWQWREAVANAAEARRNAGVAQANADLANRRNVALTAANRQLDASRDALRRNLYTAEIQLAAIDWQNRVIPRMKELLARQVPDPGQDDLRGFEWHYLHRLCHAERRVLEPGIGALTALAVSPDGRWVAVGGRDGSVAILAAESGEVVVRLPPHPYPVSGLAFSPDGRRLASCAGQVLPTEQGEIRVRDVETGRPLPAPETPAGCVNDVAYSPDGARLAASSTDDGGMVHIWDAETGAIVRKLEIPRLYAPGSPEELAWRERLRRAGIGQTVVLRIGNPVNLDFSPDGDRLGVALFTRPGGLLEFDVATGAIFRRAEAHPNPARHVAYGTDGRLVLGSTNRSVTIWGVTGDQPARALRVDNDGEIFPALRPDGRLLATAGNDRMVRIWDAADGRLLASLAGHDDVIADLDFTPDGRTLVTASWDGTVRTWDPEATPEVVALAGNAEGGIDDLSFRDDGALLAVSSYPSIDIKPGEPRESRATVWDLTAGRRLFTVSRDTNSIWFPVAFRPKIGDLVVAGGWARNDPITLYDTRSGALLRETVPDGLTGIRHLVASPDGRVLASDHGASADLILWDAATFRPLRRLQGHTRQINGLAFDPTGRRLASASLDDTVRIWEVDTGRELRSLSSGDRFAPAALAFHPDGRRLAVGGGWHDGIVSIWDTQAARKLDELRGHSSVLVGLAYSPDGRRLATSASDGQIKLWDTDSGDELLTLRGSGTLAFHPNGRVLASGGGYGYTSSGERNLVRLWDSAPINAPSIRLAPGGDLDPFDRAFPADPFAR